MRVLVTGGTGFVGSHAVMALLADGHEVRLLVRTPSKVEPTLRALGAGADELARVEAVVGDLEQPDTVAPAVTGMDAVVHAASVYSLDVREADRIARVNGQGTQAVLGAAVAEGCTRIVHVSSLVSLTPMPLSPTPDSPPGDSDPVTTPYAASKSAQEAYARTLQGNGAPLVTVLPGGVWGPQDPYDGESTQLMRSIARGQFRVGVPGGLQIVDVRDVAALIAAVVAAGPEVDGKHYAAATPFLPIKQIARMVSEATGTKPGMLIVPSWLALGAGRAAAWLQRRVGARLSLNFESIWLSTVWHDVDTSASTADLGVTFRPAAEIIRDQAAWQQAAGRL